MATGHLWIADTVGPPSLHIDTDIDVDIHIGRCGPCWVRLASLGWTQRAVTEPPLVRHPLGVALYSNMMLLE
ncbi:hypothetical protein ACRE_081060 [Hapsidospora chrysogenum ATCC 11550]|uniref:Uncharacterized protein n=1 Tax=Hapsidospora chrysogenum (strain ATCC 11550 / CBS 779.69 / DSM 880 / IAM 14645 / JCM 23072 / IMI 49137) TaxID=857340 RepID=A0A086SVP9_HAPC1|nr:hypothetical protein ACRE_081060 [Hapsidospora chrysogenum ATCC 11550]